MKTLSNTEAELKNAFVSQVNTQVYLEPRQKSMMKLFGKNS